MSYVTTVVIFGRYIPQEAEVRLAEGYIDENGRHVSFGDLSAYAPTQDCDGWSHWHGSKGPESSVFGGAFNYLADDRLKAWLATVPWYGRVAVLLGHEEGDDGFEMWTFGEGSDAEEPNPFAAPNKQAITGDADDKGERGAVSEDGKPIFGDGTCARPDCLMPCRENQLMCTKHWWLVPLPLRTKVWQAFRAYDRGYGDLATLRAAQQEAIDAVVARSTS